MFPRCARLAVLTAALACSATVTHAQTVTMKAGFQKIRDAKIATTKTTPDVIAAGRSRPARLAFFAGSVAGGDESVMTQTSSSSASLCFSMSSTASV